MIEQVEPDGVDGWSKFTIWPRKLQHICCDCLMVHDVEMRVDNKRWVWMRWRTNKKATATQRKEWSEGKRLLWRMFFQ